MAPDSTPEQLTGIPCQDRDVAEEIHNKRFYKRSRK